VAVVREMSRQEAYEFMAAGARTGKLAVSREDGSPHVTPVWFIVDGDDLVFTTWHESVKFTAIGRDPRVALLVEDERPPYAFVLVSGTVSVSSGLGELVEYATRIGGRYMGESLAEEFGARNGVPGEHLVRLSPSRIVARERIAE